MDELQEHLDVVATVVARARAEDGLPEDVRFATSNSQILHILAVLFSPVSQLYLVHFTCWKSRDIAQEEPDLTQERHKSKTASVLTNIDAILRLKRCLLLYHNERMKRIS